MQCHEQFSAVNIPKEDIEFLETRKRLEPEIKAGIDLLTEICSLSHQLSEITGKMLEVIATGNIEEAEPVIRLLGKVKKAIAEEQ